MSLIIFLASARLSDGLAPGNLLCGSTQHQEVKLILIYPTGPVINLSIKKYDGLLYFNRGYIL